MECPGSLPCCLQDAAAAIEDETKKLPLGKAGREGRPGEQEENERKNGAGHKEEKEGHQRS